MFLPRESYPVIRYLEAHFDEVATEMRTISHDRYEPIVDELVERGRWAGYGLFDDLDPQRGEHFAACARACPVTTGIVTRVPGLLVSAFVLMEGNTSLPPHYDEQEPRFYRFLMGLDPGPNAWLQVGDERLEWRAGHCTGFDPRTRHSAANDSENPRVLLSVDLLASAAQEPIPAAGPSSRVG